MRTVINQAMGWEALPFIAAVGAAYIWIVSKLIGREEVHPQAARSERKAA